jgi:general secretion pathway protein M
MRPTAWVAVKDSLSAFWDERDAREKKLIMVAGTVIALALVYLVLINPALSGRKQLQKRLPVLREQAAELQVLAKQAMELRNTESSAPATTEPPTEESIGTSLVHSGLKPRSIAQTGDGFKVVLPASSFSAVIAWLAEKQQDAGLVVSDAQFEAQSTTDTVNATFTLRQPHSNAGQQE